MTDHLTRIEGVPDRSQVHAGMAFFAGTGPEGKTCGGCALRGYYREGKGYFDERLQRWTTRRRRTGGCAQFKKLSGRHGPPVDSDWSACKYFELRPADAK